MIKLVYLVILLHFPLFSQTIAEKKASLASHGGDLSGDTEKYLNQVNIELDEARQDERKLTQEAYQLYKEGAKEARFEELLVKIKELRNYIASLQESWREMISKQGLKEKYALWYQPETTLEQLIIDYGSQDYVYLMKPEIGGIKISVDSNLPIPQASWNEMLELVLNQNGIGVKQLNPFLRELYLLSKDKSTIQLITNQREDLEILSPDARIAFLVTPALSDVQRLTYFLNSFAPPESSKVEQIGRDIFIIAKVAEVKELLRLYDFMAGQGGAREYRAMGLAKVSAEEMEKVLKALFQPPPKIRAAGPNDKASESFSEWQPTGLQILTLGARSQVLFLMGSPEELKRAEEIVQEIEGQIGGSRKKVIHWYTVKHSDATELAEVLSKVYSLMISEGVGYEGQEVNLAPAFNGKVASGNTIEQKTVVEPLKQPYNPFLPPELYPQDPYFQYPSAPIAPAFVFPASPIIERKSVDTGNFIVDAKTGAIVMVVEADLLPKLKELVKKMDVPKKMVQLEVLLFEKRIAKQNNYGLNLLRLGSDALNQTSAGINFNERDDRGVPTGIFDFFWSRKKSSGIPAFDLSYRFLLSQEDVTINASPSVLTVNQTPAFISIQEEISVNTGIVEIETAGGTTLKDAFQRAQYGITVKVIPTIHPPENEDELPTVSLDSDITFDTFDTLNATITERPNVTRRNVKNLARVADGETVIIGGLRRKVTEDGKDGVPFLGEIPGIGKLFSDTSLQDGSVEMFLFITPKIVSDPACDLEWIRMEEMLRRPGDIPEFLCALVEARECEKNRLFDAWMTTLFGREPPRCYTPGWMDPDTCGSSYGEYDGR